jgi:hypothetical protein
MPESKPTKNSSTTPQPPRNQREHNKLTSKLQDLDSMIQQTELNLKALQREAATIEAQLNYTDLPTRID